MASTFSPTDFTSYSEAGPTLPVTNVAGENAQLIGLNEGLTFYCSRRRGCRSSATRCCWRRGHGPQRQVIGPAIFPFYWRTLKIALGGALIAHLALAVAALAGGAAPQSVIGPLASFPFGPAVTVFGWVTLTFALLDVNVPQLLKLSQWSPRTLPPVKARDPRPRWTVFAEIVGSTFFLVWWLSVPHYPFLIFGPAAAFLALTPVWTRLYVAVASIWLASLAGLWIVLLRPDWTRGRLAASLIAKAAGLLIAVVLFQANGLVQLAAGVEATPTALGTVTAINTGCRFGVVVWAAVAAWELARDGARLFYDKPA